jgi:spore maturation protein CgeB
VSKKILLVDYPHPDGFAREKYLKQLGCEVYFYNLVKSRLWPEKNLVKERIKKVLSFLGSANRITNKLDTYRLNKELLNTVREFRPDIILVIKGDSLFIDTLKTIRKIGSPLIINWYADSILSPNRKEFIYSFMKLYDFFFLIDEIELLPLGIRKQIELINKNVFTLPFAANTEFYRPVELSSDEKDEFHAEISFVGTINPVRKKVLEQLANFNLKIWGPQTSSWGDWLTPDSLLRNAYQKRCVFGSDVVKVYSISDIVLDIHFLYSLTSEIPNVTTRVYEVPASGGFVLTNNSPQLTKLFRVGEEIISYSNEKEIKKLIEYYLNNPEERKKVSLRGRERVLREHTYLQRLKMMFSLIERNG